MFFDLEKNPEVKASGFLVTGLFYVESAASPVFFGSHSKVIPPIFGNSCHSRHIRVGFH
jgi:hypothetical protein